MKSIRVHTIGFDEDFIAELTRFIMRHYAESGRDLSRLAVVFGGRRPALFLRRQFALEFKKSYFPPRMFSMDEFIDYIISPRKEIAALSDLDLSYLIYGLSRRHLPQLLLKRQTFAQFLPWAKEIISFIEQLDLEDIDNERLRSIEASAVIGYEVPDSINKLLEDIIPIRSQFHRALRKRNVFSRGLRYSTAARLIAQREFPEFDRILFCNFYYLHKTESTIIRHLLDADTATCLFQADSGNWSVLEHNEKELALRIRTPDTHLRRPELNFYQGFDMHSQVCLVREVIKKHCKNTDDTVIVLPRPETLVPLLTELTTLLDDFNVSLGYPLCRSPLFALFDTLKNLGESRKGTRYYTKDYLRLLRHPLVKNCRFSSYAPEITRVLVHKIEELLSGVEPSAIGGSLFISLDELESQESLYHLCADTLAHMDIEASPRECAVVLRELHEHFFKRWADVGTFAEFSRKLKDLLTLLITNTRVLDFALHYKVLDRILAVQEEYANILFRDEAFAALHIWEIFLQRLEGELVSFSGSPLKGLQILGLFETRSLNFRNVIVMDLNESVFPRLKVYEPLIPREVMLTLGLNRLEKEEEIQRYQFMRLLYGAQRAYLIYEENQAKEKSRFIEELLWRNQKIQKKLDVFTIPKASFRLHLHAVPNAVKKTKSMVEFLRTQTYSATRINTYLNCPLQFYYRYILGIKEGEDLLSDPQGTCIGKFIHELLAWAFEPFKGKTPRLDKKFQKSFTRCMEEKFAREIATRMRSDSFLLKRIIENRLRRFLESERASPPKRIISLEEEYYGTIPLCGTDVSFRYTIDRMDELEDNNILIIDYKTGGANIAPKKLSSLNQMELTREAIRNDLRSFQLPLYYYFTCKKYPERNINAQLYNIRTLERKDFIASADSPHKDELMRISLAALEYTFSELFNPGVCFEPDRDERRCAFCNFNSMCT